MAGRHTTLRDRIRRATVRGFTLLELMLVVSIISILTTVAVPGINNTVSDQLLLAEGFGLSGWVYDSRMLALGIKRCVRVRGYVGTNPSSSEFTVDLDALSARELNTADCETSATITTDSNYVATTLPDYRPPSGYKIRLEPDVNTHPVIWRPVGYSRGNANSNFSDDGFKLKVTDSRGKFVIVRVSPFGQVCTGNINQLNPAC